jgi:hypothetical protein
VPITPDNNIDASETTGHSGRFTYMQDEEDNDDDSNEHFGKDK